MEIIGLYDEFLSSRVESLYDDDDDDEYNICNMFDEDIVEIL